MTDTLLNPPVPRVEAVPEGMTHSAFMRLAPDDQKAELIDGVFIVPSPAFFAHERLQAFLLTVLRGFADQRGLGEVVGSRYAVYIDEDQTYEPDVLFVRRERKGIITEQKLLEAPDLVVEILSSSTARYDRGSKRENYEKAGVRELWLIDPYGPSGTQFFQRKDNRLIEVAPVGSVIHSVALPDFRLNTAWLWPDETGNLPNAISVLRELGAV